MELAPFANCDGCRSVIGPFPQPALDEQYEFMKFILAPIGMSVNKNIIKLVKMSKIVKSFNSIKIESDKEGKNRCVANR